MPGSRRSFSYTLTPAPEDTDKVLKQAERILGWACDGDRRVECHGVTGEALGIIRMDVTVHGRDRWATTQIMQDILNLILWGLKHPKHLGLDLQSERLDPHENRGYLRGGRTKRFREPKTTAKANPPDAPSEA
jgi:hypothetical protein